MSAHFGTSLGVAVLATVSSAVSSAAAAQKPPAIRSLGPIVRVSTEPLASVAAAVPLPDGRVYVNDIVSRRVLLFDSTLAKAQVVADSTAATSNAYGARPGTLIAYRPDTALFIDPASSSMPVLSPAGRIARVLAIPKPETRPFTIASAFYTPGFDAQGRLVYYAPPTPPPWGPAPPGTQTITDVQDSAFIVRFDLVTRTLDTVGAFKTPKPKSTLVRDDGRVVSLTVVPDILPLVDDWAVCPDGSIALVRGRDYHVDWLNTNGRWTSTPRMAFDWQRLDDSQKTALIDSGLTAIKARRDSIDAARVKAGPPPRVAGDGGGRGGGGGGAPPGAVGAGPGVLDGRPGFGDIPDYRPPFTRGSVRADAEGNLWIRTTIMVKGQPVYDIVTRRGVVTDRVLLPPFRTVAGFGPGMVYMAVKDSAGIVHLERARVK